MAAASGGTADGIRGTLVDFCKVTKTVAAKEIGLLHKLVEVVKHHLKSKCIALVGAAANFPVLWSYSCDATPLKTSVTHTSSHEGSNITRKGRALHELLLERGLVKCTGASGQDEVAFMYSDIRSLAAGKTTGTSSLQVLPSSLFCERSATGASLCTTIAWTEVSSAPWTGASDSATKPSTLQGWDPIWARRPSSWNLQIGL